MNAARSSAHPTLLVKLLLGGLALTALTGCGGAEKGSTSEDPLVATGEKIYRIQCLMCHQAEGEGIPDLQPPLAGSEAVTGEVEPLVHWILGGSAAKQGPSEYSNFMPPFELLSDDDVAAVATYIRTGFGNQAARVEPSEVAAARAKLGD